MHDHAHTRKSAMNTATYRGFKSEAEDFAQEVALSILTGRKTTMANHLIDYLRKEFGDSRYDNQIKRATRSPEQITESIEPQAVQTDDLDFEKLLTDMLTQKEQAYMNLIHRWGFTLNEVGKTFGVSESRVSQEVKEIYRKSRLAIMSTQGLYSTLRGTT